MNDELYATYITQIRDYRYLDVEIPVRLRDGIARYLSDYRPVGGFLRAVIENNLRRSCALADEDAQAALPAIAMFLHGHAPFGSIGSPAAYEAWTAKAEPPERFVSMYDEKPDRMAKRPTQSCIEARR